MKRSVQWQGGKKKKIQKPIAYLRGSKEWDNQPNGPNRQKKAG